VADVRSAALEDVPHLEPACGAQRGLVDGRRRDPRPDRLERDVLQLAADPREPLDARRELPDRVGAGHVAVVAGTVEPQVDVDEITARDLSARGAHRERLAEADAGHGDRAAGDRGEVRTRRERALHLELRVPAVLEDDAVVAGPPQRSGELGAELELGDARPHVLSHRLVQRAEHRHRLAHRVHLAGVLDGSLRQQQLRAVGDGTEAAPRPLHQPRRQHVQLHPERTLELRLDPREPGGLDDLRDAAGASCQLGVAAGVEHRLAARHDEQVRRLAGPREVEDGDRMHDERAGQAGALDLPREAFDPVQKTGVST
jgi:hypothetical protein